MSLGRNKAKIYMHNEIVVRFSDVVGADEAKQELKEAIDFLKDPGKLGGPGSRITKAP